MAILDESGAPAASGGANGTGGGTGGAGGAGGANGAGGGGKSDWIREGSTATFMADVMEASRQHPVLVDFWAPWCEPCKQLTPILESVVNAHRGAIRLVKIDIDQNQELAQQLRVQSVPTVYAFYQGQPVDAFQGALPESQIKQFVERLIRGSGATADEGDPIEILMNEGYAAREDTQHETAAELFLSAWQEDRESARADEAVREHLNSLLDAKQTEAARKFLDSLPEKLRDGENLKALHTRLELAEAATYVDHELIADMRKRIAANDDDLEARLALARELHAADEREEAAKTLLEIIERNRNWNDQEPRKLLVKYFEAWGEKDPLTQQYRQALSALLFS